MPDQVSLTVSTNGIANKLNQMLDRAQTVRGWLNRVAYPMVVESTRMRWASEGASEGSSWPQLKPAYAMWKLKKYAGFPGGGSKLLVATGRLVESMTGDDTRNHLKLVEDTRLTVGSTVPYAKYVDEKRSITVLGDETRQALQNALRNYLSGVTE